MKTKTGIQRAVEVFENSPTRLAAAVGNGVTRQNVEHWLSVGRVAADKCAEVSAAAGIPMEDLNEKVNWPLVRKLARKPISVRTKEKEPTNEAA